MTDIHLRSNMKVDLVQSMGGDHMVVAAARVSTAPDRAATFEEATSADDQAGLIRFLMKNRHGTPFEHNAMTFRVEAPIFVFREWHRHRIGWSYNENSARYSKLKPEFYLPALDRPLVQVGKPGHYSFKKGSLEQHGLVSSALRSSYTRAWFMYEDLLESGIAKEVARSTLPVATYSTMYATCNARSLMAFLSLRTRDDGSTFPSFPQHEIEVCAKAMEEHFQKLFPITHAAFQDFGRVAP